MEEEEQIEESVHIPATSDRTTSDILGKRHAFAVIGKLEWFFLILSLANILTCIGITIERLVHYVHDKNSPDFTFAILLLISASFCSFYVINGVFRELQYEIYAYIAGVLMVISYCVFEYIFHVPGRTEIKLIRLILSCVVGVPNIIMAVIVARRFGWLQFRIIGASEALLNMYGQLMLFLSLQKFDFQATLSILILTMSRGMDLCLEEKLTLGVGITFAVVWLIMGFIAVQKEVKWLLFVFAITGLFQPAYVIYKIQQVYSDIPNIQSDMIIKYSVLGVGSLSFLVRCILLNELGLVYRNFGFGLNERGTVAILEPIMISSGDEYSNSLSD